MGLSPPSPLTCLRTVYSDFPKTSSMCYYDTDMSTMFFEFGRARMLSCTSFSTTLFPSMKIYVSFTMKRYGKVLNFLDFTICFLPDDITTAFLLLFSIFRKTTFTQSIYPQRSLHPASHKFASLYVAIRNMLSLTLSLKNRRYRRHYG